MVVALKPQPSEADRAINNPATTTMTNSTSNPLGEVHSLTCRMSELARTIERLHPDSPSRASSIKEYEASRAKAKAIRDSITDTVDRKEATWHIRTARKPVDNTGRPIA